MKKKERKSKAKQSEDYLLQCRRARRLGGAIALCIAHGRRRENGLENKMTFQGWIHI
jgi:hypothetical protein